LTTRNSFKLESVSTTPKKMLRNTSSGKSMMHGVERGLLDMFT
jgi:hypothetical protein